MKTEMDAMGMDERQRTCWLLANRLTLIAVGLGKVVFGGLGYNLFNPAMVGRAFVMLSFAKQMGAPLALSDLGVEGADLDRATDIALARPYWNPRDITADGIRALLQNAWSGTAPGQ